MGWWMGGGLGVRVERGRKKIKEKENKGEWKYGIERLAMMMGGLW